MEKFRGELTAFVNSLYEEERKVLVFGEGSVGAPVMMIGEAPGEQESLQGRPFVGKAGKNLDAFLEQAGMDRRELYVTNTVKFRPTKRSAAGRTASKRFRTIFRKVRSTRRFSWITIRRRRNWCAGSVPAKPMAWRKTRGRPMSAANCSHGGFRSKRGRTKR